jgi:hypothetical protein
MAGARAIHALDRRQRGPDATSFEGAASAASHGRAFPKSKGEVSCLIGRVVKEKYAPRVLRRRCMAVRGRRPRRATGYAWLVWEVDRGATPKLMWVPPCRRQLERESDYLR